MNIFRISLFSLIISFFLVAEVYSNDVWTLERCISYALEKSPDVEAARARVDASSFNLDFQRASFYPRLDFSASTGHIEGESTSSFSVLRNVTEDGIISRDISGEDVSAALTLNIPIIKEGVFLARNAPSINIADSQLLLERGNNEILKRELVYEVSSAFFAVFKNREDIKVEEEHIKSLAAGYASAKSKYEEGLISKNDLLEIEINLSSGENTLVKAKGQSELLTAELAIKVGLELTEAMDISYEDFIVPELPPLNELLGIALNKRKEIFAQGRRLDIVKEDKKLAESLKYPNVDIVSSYSVANSYSSDSKSLWSSSVQLKMPLYDFGALDSLIESKKSRLMEEEKNVLAIKGSIIREVIAAHSSINSLRSDIKLKAKIEEQSAENARSEKSRFEQELAPYSSVLESEYKLYESRKSLVNAKYDLNLAYLQLLKATGSDLSSYPPK